MGEISFCSLSQPKLKRPEKWNPTDTTTCKRSTTLGSALSCNKRERERESIVIAIEKLNWTTVKPGKMEKLTHQYGVVWLLLLQRPAKMRPEREKRSMSDRAKIMRERVCSTVNVYLATGNCITIPNTNTSFWEKNTHTEEKPFCLSAGLESIVFQIYTHTTRCNNQKQQLSNAIFHFICVLHRNAAGVSFSLFAPHTHIYA